jgi:glycosyltransferase involved in cell wall biosynthesis
VKTKRPSLAIIVPGGVGTGKDNIGVPVLLGLIKLICARYDVTIFSLAKINSGFVPDGFSIVNVYHSSPFVRLISFPLTFRRHHKEKNFVAVHGFWAMPSGFLAVIVGKLFGVKSIVSVLGGDAVALPEVNYGRLHKPLLRKLTFWTLINANHSNALTQYLVNNLKEYGFEKHMDVIPWGVDSELFDYHPKPLPSLISVSSVLSVRTVVLSVRTFLHVANLHPVKDQETLLRAFHIISSEIPSRLIILGSGVDHSKVIQLIQELRLTDKVSILDPVPYEKLSAIYHSADILLHTSLSEGQCEVVTEAMSCGLPVCGTRVGLMHDLPDCCVTVDVRDYRSLAEKVIALTKDPERMNDLRMKAHRWTSQHDITWTANKLMDLYGS